MRTLKEMYKRCKSILKHKKKENTVCSETVCKPEYLQEKDISVKMVEDDDPTKENATMVETNMGKIPIEDYKEIIAIQYGFDSYEDMRKEGFDIPETWL